MPALELSGEPRGGLQLSFTEEAPPARGLTHKTGTFAEVYAQGQSKSFAGKSKTTLVGDSTGGGEEESGGGKLSVTTASFNLTNSIIGAGIVGLAFVTTNAGIIPFIVFMVIAGYGSILTLDMLAAGADMAGFKDYERIGIAAMGVSGKWLSSAFIILHCYAACTAYIVLIATTAPVIGAAFGFEADPVILQIIVAVTVVLPLSMLKSLEGLASSAIIAIFIYQAVAIYVIYSGFADTWYRDVHEVPWNGTVARVCPPAEETLWIGTDLVAMFKNFPTIIFAFVCHQTAPPIFSELEGGEVRDMNKVNRNSIGAAFVLYGAVGVAGYFAYGANTFSSVLMNLRHCVCTEWSGPEHCTGSCLSSVCADDNNVASLLNAGFLFAVITGFPTVHFSLRRSLVTVLFGEGKQFSWPIHSGIAFANVALCLFLAIVVGDSISVVFNWAGSIAAPGVSFILPCFFFLALLKKSGGQKEYDTVGFGNARFFLVFGCIMVCVGIFLQFGDTFGLL